MMLLKFSSNKEHLECLKKGKFYMKSGEYYIEQEKIHGNKGIGDSLELQNTQHEVKLTLFPKGIDMKPFDLHAKTFNTTSQRYYRKPIFCVTALGDDDIIKIEDREEFKLNIDNIEVEKIKKDFGKYVLVLNGEYIDKLKEKCSKENIELVFDKVKYVDSRKNCFERQKAFFDKSTEFFFFKDKSFKHQKEFRFVAFDKEIEKQEAFEISIDVEDEGEILEVDDLFSGNYVFKYINK